MKAVAGDLPPEDGSWAFEVKWDGMRVLARVAGGRVRLASARGADVTDTFPELEALAACVDTHDVLLDGEVVATDDDGVPSFARLQRRMHVADRADAARRVAEVPVSYLAFDVLEVDGEAVWGRPWSERRALLESLVAPAGPVQVPAAFPSGGRELLAAAEQRGLEGVVAKRIDSAYEPGARSPRWRKVKVRHTQEFVVAGWLGGAGNRSGAIGSLVLGCHEGGVLRWAGNVGTGFTGAELARLGAQLGALRTDDHPFAERPPPPTGTRAHWVAPELVVQVAFAEWTPDRRLRHPSYLGQREDKAPEDVSCEP
jgi:bifunctional non-homologous end joining protein LigD